MAKLSRTLFLNNKGQSAVEYILLLAVISTLGFSFYNSQRFKDFMGGNAGFFEEMKKGMEYSYRYGREYRKSVDHETAMGFEYNGKEHDTYFDRVEGSSRFFAGIEPYGE